MSLTSDQIQTMAPDAQVLAAGQKLGAASRWQGLGRQDSLVWGECSGTSGSPYHVQADLSEMAYRCSCPSRKYPCKHVIGLLTLIVTDPPAAPEAAPPQWVTDWLAQREARTPVKAPDPAKQLRSAIQKEKRAEERLQRVTEGIDALDLWLCDIVRNGLGGLEAQPATFWERQAARLVDAEAPGLAAWVRRLARIPKSSPRWPERLLAELGRIELLIHAFRRIDRLDPLLQHDARQLIGWRLSKAEVAELGEKVVDEWVFLGQWIDEQEQIRTQRTWLQSATTGRIALVLQFAAAKNAPFPFVAAINTRQEMELHFWPSTYPLRALIAHRIGEAQPSNVRRPGYATIEEFLAAYAAALALNPWLDRFCGVLHDVTPLVTENDEWLVRDRSGATLPLLERGYWRSLANSGGDPMDLHGEWNGFAIRPMAFRVIEDIDREGER
jgi:SWIM zinc finger